ncbi:MAG: winged helix-turn-helix domain-containing protein [Candidatus Eremiobacteraeota bacterium]|nr:winged helix-turn-helix domain-containing protein [Candidatus Eremiobacteraeota bacterium]
MSSPLVRLRLLGGYEISADGIPVRPPPTAKARSLLAYLALRRGERLRRDVLTLEFWPDAEPTSARNNLKTALSQIRKTFKDAGVEPDAVVAAAREDVRWTAPATVDAREFECCAADEASERARALALYRGEFVPGDYTPWANDVRDRLAARFEDLLRAELVLRGTPALAERILLLDPFCNDAYVALIEDALRRGRTREAQRVYRRYALALAEIGSAPSAELAARVGMRAPVAPEGELGFVGRAHELLRLRAWLDDPARPPALIVAGIAGIGKHALVAEALRAAAADDIATLDAPSGEPSRAAARVIVCARPETLASARSRFPGARELLLGPLTRDEVALGLARRFPADEIVQVGEAVWQRCCGHPLLLKAELGRLAERDASGALPASERRLPRSVERRFAEQLRAAGDDAQRVAELLALEPQLDDDDLVALLDFSLERVCDARDRLTALEIVHDEQPARFTYPVFADVALSALAPGRRRQTIARITERLALHEHPSAKLRRAAHFVALGREREAARAYLDAGRDYVAFAAWRNALDAYDAGIALLERTATSAAATALLRELHLARGNALYEYGDFAASVRALDGVLQYSDARADGAQRAGALVTMAYGLSRLYHTSAAWSAARQAVDEARASGDLHAELLTATIVSRLLHGDGRYEDAMACVVDAYERAVDAREWRIAAALARRAADTTRRQFRFEDCYRWAELQLDASILAGPEMEAEAHYGIGAVHYAVNRLDDALAHAREGLRLVAGIRRRHALSPLPLGMLEWCCQSAVVHTHLVSGAVDEALGESAALLRSPWIFNMAMCGTVTLSILTDVYLAANTPRELRAAVALAQRIPSIPVNDPSFYLDRLSRARIAARTEPRDAAVAQLRAAFHAIDRAAPIVTDQIHIAYELIAGAARGLDDALAVRAGELGAQHRRRLVEAAGPLWGGPHETAAASATAV